MGIFHYKGNFIKQENNEIFYKFYPNYIDSGHLNGEFKINLESWKPTIISYVDVEEENWFFEGKDKFYLNERPVFALSMR